MISLQSYIDLSDGPSRQHSAITGFMFTMCICDASYNVCSVRVQSVCLFSGFAWFNGDLQGSYIQYDISGTDKAEAVIPDASLFMSQ